MRNHSPYTEKMCDLYDVPLELAYAVMQVESGFTPASAASSTGDYGLMQINSINAGWLKDELGSHGYVCWMPDRTSRLGATCSEVILPCTMETSTEL